MALLAAVPELRPREEAELAEWAASDAACCRCRREGPRGRRAAASTTEVCTGT